MPLRCVAVRQAGRPELLCGGAFVAVCALLAVAGTPELRAQEGSSSIGVGARVVPRFSGFTLGVDGRAVERSSKELHTYRVEWSDGRRLWLKALLGELRGWARAEDVISVDRAIDYFDDWLRMNPRDSFPHAVRGLIWEYDYPDDAFAEFTEAIRNNPRFATALAHRARLFFNKKAYDKAIADYNEAIRLDPDAGDAYAGRGNVWIARKDPDKALADYDEAIRVDPRNSLLYTDRANAWYTLGELDKAIADYTEAIRLDTRCTWAYRNRGLTRYNRKEYDKAIADFSEAIRLDPNYALAYCGRGDTWTDKQEYDNAIADYGEAIRLDPHDAGAYCGRGAIWHCKQQLDRAIADYTGAIRVDSRSAWAYAWRGSTWSDKNEYDKAIADCDEAIRIDPQLACAYNNRGWALRLNGDWERAFADFDQALRSDPEYAWAYRNRALVWQFRKEYDKALEDFERAMRIGPKEGCFPYERAIQLFMARRDGAADEASAAIQLWGWRGEWTVYAVLLGHFAARRAKQTDKAKAFLDDAAAHADRSAWPYPIVKYLRGDLSEERLMAAAGDNAKMTNALCYLGFDALEKGKYEQALAHFCWVRDHAAQTYYQHALSVAELDRLNVEQAAGDGP
jgi:tetratricopeptide (TPR) repeat protein